jgi:hypothetical protein
MLSFFCFYFCFYFGWKKTGSWPLLGRLFTKSICSTKQNKTKQNETKEKKKEEKKQVITL